MKGLLAFVLVAALPVPVAGDWLVMHDGTRVETQGSWEVKGRQVIFTMPGGTLSALRASDVDLEASAAASRPEPTAAPEPERRRPPVLVLTNEDLATPEDEVDEADTEDAEDDDVDEDGEEDDEDEGAGAGEPAGEPVEVVAWAESEGDESDGLELQGTVRNGGDRMAAEIRVTVTVAGDEGEPPLTAQAFLSAAALGPGQSTAFRVLLPGIYSLLADPVFEVRSRAFTIGPAKPSPAESEDAEPEDEPAQ